MGTYIRCLSPTLSDWTNELLDHCYIIEVLDGAYLAAVVWGNEGVGGDGHKYIEMHACCAPQYKGRWLTRSVINQLFKINDYVDVKWMIAEHTGELPERIWRRFGFHRKGAYMIRDMENFDGWCKETGFDGDGRIVRPVDRRAGNPEGQGKADRASGGD